VDNGSRWLELISRNLLYHRTPLLCDFSHPNALILRIAPASILGGDVRITT